MKTSTAIAALVLSVPLCASAQGGPVLTAPVTGKPTLVIAGDPAFEQSLSLGTGGPTSASLTWRSYPGAHGYRVLRSQTMNGTPVAFEVRSGGLQLTNNLVQFTAALIPNSDFVFRVVATNASGAVLDTTQALQFHTRAVALQPPPNATCTASPDSISLSWASVPGSAYYRLRITTAIHGPHGNSSSARDTIVHGTSFVRMRSREFAGGIEVTPEYSFADHPMQSDTTRVAISSAYNAHIFLTTSGPCQ